MDYQHFSYLHHKTGNEKKRKEKKERMVRILGILLDRSHLQPNYLKPKMRMLLREKVFDD
jgi:hypothetical protein